MLVAVVQPGAGRRATRASRREPRRRLFGEDRDLLTHPGDQRVRVEFGHRVPVEGTSAMTLRPTLEDRRWPTP